MKKMSLMLLAACAFVATASAQGGGNFQRRTVEERVASVHHVIDSAFSLGAAKQAQVDTVFAGFYRAQDAKMQELMAGGTRPDRETMMAERKKLTDARDDKLKDILTADQLKKWKDEVEPSMRPQRPGGGGGNR